MAKVKTTASTKTAREQKQAPTYAQARETVTTGIKQYGKSKNTLNSYDGYIRRGREFVAQFVKEQEAGERLWMAGGAELLMDEDDELLGKVEPDVSMDPDFHKAFDGPPLKCTPLAIAMFLAHKCFTEKLGKSTADGIHSAFVNYYSQLFVCLLFVDLAMTHHIHRENSDGVLAFRGPWDYDEATKKCKGNPARAPVVEDMLKACKNKDGESERRHSRAMSIEDMRRLHDYFSENCPVINLSMPFEDQREAIAGRGSHLFFNAFASSAFTIWLRIGEVTSLQYRHLEFLTGSRRAPFSNGEPHFFRLNLRNRKNWQKREKNGEHQLSGHKYNIYPQPDNPEMDMYTHLLDWLDFYEQFLLGRPLEPEDYLFPTVGANGASVQPSRPMSADVAQKKIIEWAKKAGIPNAELFTTHCFRRGGAQYRFMFAPVGRKWILARIRWWGGWAIGEHRDTLIRYLLDELWTYEQDHSDALRPNNPESNSFQPGEQPVTILEDVKQEISSHIRLEFANERRRMMDQVLAGGLVGPGMTGYRHMYPPLTAHAHQPLQPTSFGPAVVVATPFAVPSISKSITCPTAREDCQTVIYPAPHSATIPPPDVKPILPGISRGSGANAWKEVIRDWEHADPSRSLYVALKDWKEAWRKEKSIAVKYNVRKIVALEFIETYQRDETSFINDYPECRKGFTPLAVAIRQRQQERGAREVRSRRSDAQNSHC
ncbi:hypothetical protein CVT26_012439 [Gymnopilus dilepis]|uniref:Tyr recombinase domain-containing protein n=1 Tax=Gymnopilus dilepis TaxID=231916 RepID=A0A409YWB2_9AGAR|nr:hypothetical protein CVT26_012439 [Gymnopilus dilepis]